LKIPFDISTMARLKQRDTNNSRHQGYSQSNSLIQSISTIC
jgi:hypothetical protein